MKPALVVLAAGGSSRLGQCKALVALTPRTPLELLLESGRDLDCVPPLVVTGADHARIARELPPEVCAAHNRAWRAGRTGSVALAAQLRRGLDLCLAPVDVPLVPSEVFAALSRSWHQAGAPARGWLAPRNAGHFGHPVIVGRALLEELADLGRDEPLTTLRGRATDLFSIDVESACVLEDLDTPADLERLRERFRR